MSRVGICRLLLVGWVLGALASSAWAADAVDIAAAKREGTVVWYSSTPIETAQKIAQAFQAKYGITVQLFRSGGSAILGRFLQERKAGHSGVDVLTTSDPAAIADLAAQGAFVPFKPEGFDAIPDAVKDAQGNYIAQRMNLISIYGRTDLIPVADMPKSWSALTDPKYKGKMVMTDPSFTALQLGVVAMMVKLHGWAYYQALRKNDVLIVPGGQQAVDMVKRGERPITAGSDSSYAIAAHHEGHPIENFFPTDGTFAIAAPTAIVKGSPDPNAAKLLAAFMIAPETQNLFPASGNYAARGDTPPPPGSPALSAIKLNPMDFPYIEKVSGEVKTRFDEIFQ